jgi:sugar phosphate isomerase/epimerase
MYTESERLAFGHGDLHLPMGLGGIDWDALFNACIFPDRAIFNIELARRYWHWRQDCVEAMKALHPKIKTQAV